MTIPYESYPNKILDSSYGYVYLAKIPERDKTIYVEGSVPSRDVHNYKIGVTRNLKNRLSSLGSIHAAEIELVAYIVTQQPEELERVIKLEAHTLYRHKTVNGHPAYLSPELFAFGDEGAQTIIEIMEQHNYVYK